MTATDDNVKKQHGVVVVGSANQDLVAYTSTLPVIMGQTVLGQGFETSCGGKGANQAIAAANLNISPTSMICRVGNDGFGRAILDNFDMARVNHDGQDAIMSPPQHDNDTTLLSRELYTTGVAPIVVDKSSGDNMIIVIPGANHALSPHDVQSKLPLLKPRVVLVQLEILYETALESLRVGKQLNAITILNPAPAPQDEKLLQTLQRELYPLVDILVPNETELKILYGDHNDGANEEAMSKSLLDRGIQKAVVVTLGARGAMIVSKTDSDATTNSNDTDAAPTPPSTTTTTYVDAPADLPCRDTPVVDTVGAGDAFCGSLATYLSAGLSLPDAASKACGVASMSVRKHGAQSSYPTAQELPDTLKVVVSSFNTVDTTSRRPSHTITFVTGNVKKLQEVQKLLSHGSNKLPFHLVNQKIDLPELQGHDPIEVAKAKCQLAFQKVGSAVLIEDTSLCFHALNGMPGIYIKWFLEKCGHDGLNDMLVGFEDKTAYAQTVMALCIDGTNIHVFEGRTQGSIVRPRGSLDFGWDPIFEPNESAADAKGNKKTYAEMTKDEKNAISHRGRALARLREFLMEHADSLF